MKTMQTDNSDLSSESSFTSIGGETAEHVSTSASPRDSFSRFVAIDKASTVMLHRAEIINCQEARIVASAILELDRRCLEPAHDRPSDYAEVENRLVALGGVDAALVHTGRSRVDVNRTSRRIAQREACLSAFRSCACLQGRLIAFAETDIEALVPAYTLGVQAQPTSLGHYISGYVAAINRSGDRLHALYSTINHSPLGSAALATSSFPIDRSLLADLLGFDRPVENSFDAVQLAPLDIGAEIAGVATAAALTVSQLLADMERQYRSPARWLTLVPGKFTSVSTLMPQKRNPAEINRLRIETGELIGHAMTFTLKAHNMPHGMQDYAGPDPEKMLERLTQLFAESADMIGSLKFDPECARSEIEADYSAVTELASALQRAGVPPTVGHAHVSALVDFGRAQGLRAEQLPYETACEIFASREPSRSFGRFPLGEEAFRNALSPDHIVRERLGLGGSQPAEVKRMIIAQKCKIEEDLAWHRDRLTALTLSSERLDRDFIGLSVLSSP